MKFYTKQHKYYCGIDLHTKKMYVCILDAKAKYAFTRTSELTRNLFSKS